MFRNECIVVNANINSHFDNYGFEVKSNYTVNQDQILECFLNQKVLLNMKKVYPIKQEFFLH